ncbi:signal peptidase II [Chondromyces apiculatus]|uniref:Lipoprotein signal peptidase n=1 Tax=Chondromyces apiculatus DSM 436 TaxID=1192034 RepID=A0A017TFF5_9BACT|nr:signal peptidase II [Chondromyces apiculatus]EYF07974.1 Lipoprotein signal peptidase [Chondromyces apiculatus DSM 436]
MSDDAPPRESEKVDQVASRSARLHPGYPFLVIVSVLTLAADLGSKAWAKDRLGPPRPYAERKLEVIKNHLNLIYAENPGGAFGLFQDENESLRRPLFVLISVLAVVVIVWLYRKTHPWQWTLKWGLPLVLGGALGNLVDRIRYGVVVDFIQVHVTKSYTWPTFNVADIAIVVGVGLMFVDMFISWKHGDATKKAVAEEPRRDAPAAVTEAAGERKPTADEG